MKPAMTNDEIMAFESVLERYNYKTFWGSSSY